MYQTIFDWVEQAAIRLKDAGFDNCLFEARFLAAVSVGENISWILAHPDHLIESSIAKDYLSRRMRHEPLAYIAGRREFWGREFMVDSRVLIPRQETEEVIDVCLSHLALESKEHVLDLCTGSGCIAITLKLNRPFLSVVGSDISLDALQVAQENSLRLGASVQWHHGDLFSFDPKNRFDLIVCNPPYIGYDETLPKEISKYEPPHALWAEEKGYKFYQRLSLESVIHLNINGMLVLEIGYNQSSEVKNIFQTDQWSFCNSRVDLCGIERCLVFQRLR